MNTFSASQLSFPYEKAVLYNFRNLNDHLVQPPDFIGAEREVQKRHVTCPWLQGKCGARFQGLGCIVHALLSTSSGSCSLWFLILLCSPQHCPNLTLQSMVVSKPLCLFFFFSLQWLFLPLPLLCFQELQAFRFWMYPPCYASPTLSLLCNPLTFSLPIFLGYQLPSDVSCLQPTVTHLVKTFGHLTTMPFVLLTLTTPTLGAFPVGDFTH